MINLCTSKTFEGATEGALKRLKQNMLDKGARHIVIVPERFTLSGEKIIFDKLNTCGMDNLEITSFTRLAEKNASTDKKCLSSAGSLMLFTKTVLAVSDQLIKYKNCKKMTGFYQEMYAVISVLRNSGVSTDELRELNLQGITGLKLKDIAVLYDSYLKLLNEKYYDMTSLYEQFSEVIDENNLFNDCYIYILDYYFFSKVQLDIIEKMAVNSKGVTISLPINNAKNERIFPFNTLNLIKDLASKISAKLVIDSEPVKLKKEFNHIVDNMFSYEKCNAISTDNIEIYASENIEKEVELAAVKIKKDILNNSCRYRDYSIVLGDINEYAPIIKKVFSRYEIPFFIDKKEQMSEGASTRFLLDSIKAVISNFDKDYLLKIAVNPYSNISKEDFNVFDNYVLKYGINYSRFLDKFTLNEEGDNLAVSEKTREKLVKMLSVFKEEDINKNYIRDVKTFLSNNDFTERTNDFIDGQVRYGNEFYLPITRQMYDKLFEVLDEYEDILGNESSSLEEFLITIENMINDIEIGLVPVYVDSVYIGEATESMYDNVKNMIVLGCNQGVIPSLQKEATILSNNDLDLIMKNDIFISPTPKSNNNDMLFYSLELLLTAKDKLIVSYNETKGLMSEIVKELKTLFNLTEQRYDFDISNIYKVGGKSRLVKELPSIVSTKENMKLLLVKDTALKAPLIDEPYNAMFSLLAPNDAKQVLNYINKTDKVYKIANADKLYFTKNYTYVSQLEQFFACPYKHFMDYGLKLKDREEADFTSMDIGNIMHEVLEKFFKQTTDFALSDKEIKDKVYEILEDALSEPRIKAIVQKSNKQMVDKIKKECVVTCTELVKRLKYTSFVPYKFEVSFGYDGNDAIKIKIGDKTLKFIGKIDRIDKCNNHIMIIDYKTGSNVSSNFNDVYSGRKIQLYMYLSALLLQNKEFKPAGVFYQPINIKYQKDDSIKRFQYLGHLSSDKEIIDKLDNSLDTNLKSTLISGLSLTKKHELTASSKKICLDEKEFEKVCKYVNKLSEKACEEIVSGVIIPSPNSTHSLTCDYCQYKGVCGYDKQIGRKFKSMDKKVILEAIDE